MKVFKQVAFALLTPATLVFGQMFTTPVSAGSAVAPQTAPYAQTGPYSGNQYQQRPENVLPGTINYVEGQASLDGQPLAPGRSVVLQPGQTLTTNDGFAEVLLTPGAFLRLGHDSEVRIVTAGLEDTKAQLDRGTAIVEVDQLIKGTQLDVAVNGATTQIEKNGLYDFDASQQSVKVLDGKVTVIQADRKKSVGKDDEVLLASAKPLQKASFDKKSVEAQPLYVWSEARSADESQANVALASNVAAYGGWYGPGWYWNPYWADYAFLPGAGFLYSPFGWGFYSPAYIGYYGFPLGYGRYGYGFYHGPYGFHGHVAGMNAHVHAFSGGGFAGGGFHGGGFHGGGGHR